MRPDVQAAVTVVGRRDAKRDIRRINLSRADLAGADLAGADLNAVDLTGANLTRANLSDANLTRANLNSTNLNAVDLAGANLTRASLNAADLTGAGLAGANLAGAFLVRANLTDADLSGRIRFFSSTRTNITGALFAGARLDGTGWPGHAAVPEGWKLDTRSGRLTPAGTDSGPTETDLSSYRADVSAQETPAKPWFPGPGGVFCSVLLPY